MTLYEQLKAAGVPLDSHESDLYALATSEAHEIVLASCHMYSVFRNELDGKLWLDVPFAFDPWWKARVK